MFIKPYTFLIESVYVMQDNLWPMQSTPLLRVAMLESRILDQNFLVGIYCGWSRWKRLYIEGVCVRLYITVQSYSCTVHCTKTVHYK